MSFSRSLLDTLIQFYKIIWQPSIWHVFFLPRNSPYIQFSKPMPKKLTLFWVVPANRDCDVAFPHSSTSQPHYHICLMKNVLLENCMLRLIARPFNGILYQQQWANSSPTVLRIWVFWNPRSQHLLVLGRVLPSVLRWNRYRRLDKISRIHHIIVVSDSAQRPLHLF